MIKLLHCDTLYSKMKKQALLIRLDKKEYDGVKQVSIKEKWSLNQVGEEAVKFYLRARKIIKKEKC